MWDMELRHNDEISLSRQIYLLFRERILSGHIAQGEALPSTRELAGNLRVSRNTVCEAYDMLWTEGFIISRQGAPSRVAQGLQIDVDMQAGTELKKAPVPILYDFRTGQPDLSFFPWQQWSQLLRDTTGSFPVRQLEYGDPKGYAPLCEEIANWLLRARGLTIDPEDVFITSGATQALHLLVDILHRDNDVFALESPSHPGIRTVISDKGYPLYSMLVDRNGADVSSLHGKQIAAVYVTPSHQFPLGGILPAKRRAELIRLAAQKDFYIIEDDYDSEFRYSGSPVSPIFSMNSSRVVYVGTFSKTMFPALRLGFAVLPKPLQKKWRHSRRYMDVQNPVLEQIALCEFLRSRRLDKHVRHMRRIYGEKRDVLLRCVKELFSETANIWGDESGLHVALQVPGAKFGTQFERDSQAAGIRVVPVTQYCPEESEHEDKLLLGYGHLSHEQIQNNVRALHKLISQY